MTGVLLRSSEPLISSGRLATLYSALASTMIFLRLPGKDHHHDHHSHAEHQLHGGGAGAGVGARGGDPEPLDQARVTEQDTLLMELEGGLLNSSSSFPYFMLVALEAGSFLRGLLLLLSLPFAWLLGAELQVFTLVALAGLKASTVEAVSRAVLAKFFLENLHPGAFRVFKKCGERHLLTGLPSIMVEPAVTQYLEASVIGTKVEVSSGGYCTGRIEMPVNSATKARVSKEHFKEKPPSVGIGGSSGDHSGFMSICKKRYLIDGSKVSNNERVPKRDYIKPLVFHDGRLIHTPTPLHCLVIALWLPLAVPLALLRVFLGLALPKTLALPVDALLGVAVRVKGRGPPPRSENNHGVLFVCTHRSLLDPVFISFAGMRNVTTVTYSVSRVSEVLSPIRTARLTRSREDDAKTMSTLLSIGDLAVCPEGTTCREPFLLRFSALFAELTDRIVPVAVTPKLSLFHATTARGWKALDPLFFFMDPFPGYEVEFLEQLASDESCSGGGRASHEVANDVQRKLADALGYQCTNLTRKDKYRMLVGNDGIVNNKKKSCGGRSMVKKIRVWLDTLW